MSNLIKLSNDVIGGKRDLDEIGPINRINNQLSEIRDDIAVVESFSHSVMFKTRDGLLIFDTSGAATGERVVKAIRGWTQDRFHTIVYTHGHIDHVGGCAAFVAGAGSRPPLIVGHKNVRERLERYERTNDYNLLINARQFVGLGRRGYSIGGSGKFVPEGTVTPQLTYQTQADYTVGGLKVELNHARGETDDHTWAWIPEHKTICAGDFFIWNLPNAGNPQKVQCYPLEWAHALRDMESRNAELFLPAHGLPIAADDASDMC